MTEDDTFDRLRRPTFMEVYVQLYKVKAHSNYDWTEWYKSQGWDWHEFIDEYNMRFKVLSSPYD